VPVAGQGSRSQRDCLLLLGTRAGVGAGIVCLSWSRQVLPPLTMRVTFERVILSGHRGLAAQRGGIAQGPGARRR
jgi:hypothetical protein